MEQIIELQMSQRVQLRQLECFYPFLDPADTFV